MKARLSDLYTLQMGKTPSRNVPEYWQGGTYRWASVSDLGGEGKYLAETRERITRDAVERSGIKPVPADTVIMSFKLSLGKVAITGEPTFTNEAIMAFIPKDDRAPIAEYLFYQLQCHDWARESSNRAVMGATLNKASLSKVEVIVPSKLEQEEVVRRLTLLDAQLLGCRTLLNKLNELVKSRFIEMCKTVQCERVPISYFVSRDIVPVSERYSADDEISYIDISSIDSANHRVKRTQKMPVSKAPSRAQQCVRDGDLLVSTVRPALRNIAQVKTGKANLVASSGFCVLRANSCPVEYLLANLLMDDFSDAMCLVATGASYPAIKKQDVLNYRVPNLPYEQMVELSSYMRQVDKLRFDVQQQIEKLEILKKSLMQEYFG